MPTEDQPTTPTPKVGEQTPAQDPSRSFGVFAGVNTIVSGNGLYTTGLAQFAGGGSVPGLGLPIAALMGTGTLEGTNKYDSALSASVLPTGIMSGFGKTWPGTYATYRIMAAHPTLVLAAGAMMMPIIGAPLSYKEKDGAPAGAKDLITEMFEPLRVRLVMECLKSTVFGWRGFERVYEVRKGQMWLKRLKTLLPELTDIQVDDKGGFAGLLNGGVTLTPEKSFVYTYDQDGDNYYGRSRMENVRRTWSNWLNVEDNLGRLGAKTSSIIPRVGYPPGKGEDEKGNATSNFDIAKTVAYGLASGRPVVMPNLSTLEVEDIFRLPDLAKASLWSIDTIDMGNPGPAIASLLEQLNYYDKLLVRGWLRPERSLLEAQTAGSRADSNTAGDVGLTDSAGVLRDIVRAINECLIDDVLSINYGPDARGLIYAEPSPLTDDDKDVDTAILTGIAGNPQLLAKLLSEMDMAAWFKRRGIPVGDDVTIDWSGTADEMAKQQMDQLKAKAAAGPPGGGDNGDPKDEAAKVLSMAVDLIAGDVEAVEAIYLSGGNDDDLGGNEQSGVWRTINGAHVFIQGCKVVEGPAHLIGKSHDELKKNASDSAKPDVVKVHDEHIAKAMEHVDKGLGEVKDEAKKTAYRDGAQKVLQYMSPEGLQRFSKNVNGITFHESLDSLNEEHGQLTGKGADAYRRVGGFWLFSRDKAEAGGTLHLDGGDDTGDHYHMSVRDLYAHEFSHAIDGKRELSGTSEWGSAWQDEIKDGFFAPSEYSQKNVVEGFAEYGRLVFTAPKIARENYPACWAFWKSKGLV